MVQYITKLSKKKRRDFDLNEFPIMVIESSLIPVEFYDSRSLFAEHQNRTKQHFSARTAYQRVDAQPLLSRDHLLEHFSQ